MSIVPLPVFEADADPSRRDAMTDEEILARLRPPTSIVVKFGATRLIGEFPYEGDAKPGCGSKLVVRTVRGTEMAEMLTTTCSNSGCGKSISRKEMLEYIEASGGKDYPFHEHGRVLRVATIEDLNRWSGLQSRKPEMLRQARAIVAAAGMTIKIVEVEPILGGETTMVHYLSEERIDFRDAVKDLATAFGSRIDMRHVGARDEARLVADYERCGQHCCCKNFLKVLKPVSMRSAKVQKATLDPLKISGRCGRLMCCLRYEDQTYTELKARLPKLKSRVGTSEGPGIVMDTKILVQLALVRLEHDGREIAVPIEELMDPERCPKPGTRTDGAESDPLRGADPRAVARRTRRAGTPGSPGSPGRPESPGTAPSAGAGSGASRAPGAQHSARSTQPSTPPMSKADGPPTEPETEALEGEGAARGKRRRRRRKGTGQESPTGGAATPASPSASGAEPEEGADPTKPRKKRRRRRKSRDPERSTTDQQDAFRAMAQAEERGERPDDGRPGEAPANGAGGDASGDGPRKKRRRRRRGRKDES